MIQEKENYLLAARNKLNWSRKEASDATGNLISEDKLRRLETESNKTVDPEDVLLLAEAYGDPALIHYYCREACPIGRKLNGPREAFSGDVSHIVLNVLHSLNELQAREGQMVRIFRDEKLDDSERKDFEAILTEMKELKRQIEALQLWAMTRA